MDSPLTFSKHVTDLDFGLRFSEDNNASDLFNWTIAHGPVMDYMSAKSILRQAYKSALGIYDFLGEPERDRLQKDIHQIRPLSAVAMHPGEDVCTDSDMYKRVDQCIDLGIPQATGMSIGDFLELPQDMVLRIIQKVEDKRKKELEAMKRAESGKPPS